MKTITPGLMYSFDCEGEEFFVNTMPDSDTIRLMGDAMVQGFDNIERKNLEKFCEASLKDRDLHLRALDRMGNKPDRKTLLEELKENREDVGRILTNRLIRFVEGSTCAAPELLRKLKLQLGLPKYEVLKRLHFEIESPRFRKSLDVFYSFSTIVAERKN